MPVSAYQEYSSNHPETTWGRLSPKNIPITRRSFLTLMAGCNSLFFVREPISIRFGGDDFWWWLLSGYKSLAPSDSFSTSKTTTENLVHLGSHQQFFLMNFQRFQPAVHFTFRLHLLMYWLHHGQNMSPRVVAL